MRPLRGLGLLLVALGVGLLALAAIRGELRAGFFLIVPVFMGTGLLPFAGMLALMAGTVLLFLGAFQGFEPLPPDGPSPPQEPVRARHGGVVLLGPLPIVWGSDRRVAKWMVVAAVGLVLLAWLLLA